MTGGVEVMEGEDGKRKKREINGERGRSLRRGRVGWREKHTHKAIHEPLCTQHCEPTFKKTSELTSERTANLRCRVVSYNTLQFINARFNDNNGGGRCFQINAF